jgi:glycosyltransferase involved in cell wall biosynthesis
MRVALVHDYLNEFGGAERVLLALSEMYPDAPIYTAFYMPDSLAHQRFKNKDIRPSWAQKVPFFKEKLHSPLRFLAPLIWESFDFDEYDLVISSASWYITKGILTRPKTLHICYCHTPPRYLYGYRTSIDWKKNWLIRQYARLINPGMREYDYLASQRVDEFVTNSENTRKRIQKFYRRDARVIYPPIEIKSQESRVKNQEDESPYYLVIARLVGGKGLPLVVEAANKARVPVKIVGAAPEGWSNEHQKVKEMAGGTVEFTGYVDDQELAKLYAGAKAFLALAENEDFGMTVVEAMMAGTPVIAYRGGGYVETVIDGKTGVFIDELTASAVVEAMEKLQDTSYKPQAIKKHAQKFSKDRFVREMRGFVEAKYKEHKTRLRL